MLKRAAALLLLALTPALCPAQATNATTDQQSAGEVTIVGVNWRFPAHTWRGEPRADVLSGTSRTDTARIGNDGRKRIKSVGYDFQFVNAESDDVLLSYKLRSRTTIEPGATKTFSNLVADRRPQRLGADSRVRVDYRVIITRVEYADGTVWQRR